MFTKSEAFYDAIYGTMKDYEKEAQQIHAVIEQYKQSPGNALLDVACGTAAHLAFLRRDYTVVGLDFDEEMLAIARRRNHGVAFHSADMAQFHYCISFVKIKCLILFIGYTITFSPC